MATTNIDFSLLPDDLVLKILSFLPLAADPRILPRLSCVSHRLRRLSSSLFILLSSLCLPLPLSPSPSVSPSTLHKLAVCCPGLSHSGVLFHHNSSDYGLSFEIGPDLSLSLPSPSVTSVAPPETTTGVNSVCEYASSWSLFDDLYLDSSYDMSETSDHNPVPASATGTGSAIDDNNSGTNCTDSTNLNPSEVVTDANTSNNGDNKPTCSVSPLESLTESSLPSKRRKKHTNSSKKNKWVGPIGAHLANGSWSLSREQGSKLLASRFRGDSLYICDWPGCVHVEEKRKYMLFRGVFKDFKRSRVWRTIVDSKRGSIKLDCAYCDCGEMWDLHSAFCLRGFIGFHEDGEPVVRAYACENGHVSGAWTERPMYG